MDVHSYDQDLIDEPSHDEVLRAAQALAAYFDGEIVEISISDLPPLIDPSITIKRLCLDSNPGDSNSKISEHTLSETKGVFLSLNQLRQWYRRVRADTDGKDTVLLVQIADVGRRFASKYGDSCPDKAFWFDDWLEDLYELWIWYAHTS